MQLQENRLEDIMACAALTIKMDDREEKPIVDPLLLEKSLLEEEDCFLMMKEF